MAQETWGVWGLLEHRAKSGELTLWHDMRAKGRNKTIHRKILSERSLQVAKTTSGGRQESIIFDYSATRAESKAKGALVHPRPHIAGLMYTAKKPYLRGFKIKLSAENHKLPVVEDE
jgi:hypothetical protein